MQRPTTSRKPVFTPAPITGPGKYSAKPGTSSPKHSGEVLSMKSLLYSKAKHEQILGMTRIEKYQQNNQCKLDAIFPDKRERKNILAKMNKARKLHQEQFEAAQTSH